jgi:hypothetical protein
VHDRTEGMGDRMADDSKELGCSVNLHGCML